MPSPTELLSCKGKAATADAKYRLKARKLKSYSEAFHNSHGIGYSQKISTILLGVLLKSILERRHEKGYGVKGMPECHKKKFGFLWKNKSLKRLVLRKSRIFLAGDGRKQGMIIPVMWSDAGKQMEEYTARLRYMHICSIYIPKVLK